MSGWTNRERGFGMGGWGESERAENGRAEGGRASGRAGEGKGERRGRGEKNSRLTTPSPPQLPGLTSVP